MAAVCLHQQTKIIAFLKIFRDIAALCEYLEGFLLQINIIDGMVEGGESFDYILRLHIELFLPLLLDILAFLFVYVHICEDDALYVSIFHLSYAEARPYPADMSVGADPAEVHVINGLFRGERIAQKFRRTGAQHLLTVFVEHVFFDKLLVICRQAVMGSDICAVCMIFPPHGLTPVIFEIEEVDGVIVSAEIGQYLFAALALPFVVDTAYCQQYSFRRALPDTGREIGIVVQDAVIVP